MEDNRNRNIIIVVVIVVLICCCCSTLGLGYQFGDLLVEALPSL